MLFFREIVVLAEGYVWRGICQKCSVAVILAINEPRWGLKKVQEIPKMAGMKKAFVPFTCLLALTGCSVNKLVPQALPLPTERMATESGEDLAVLERGFAIYGAQCNRCHEPMMPADVSLEDWHIVTPGMAWNAGISEADETAVLKYILAAR
jgi:hypothetical protein